MPQLNIREIAEVMGGDIQGPSSGVTFSHYQFDTRAITDAHTLFFALKSETNDGHDYLAGLQANPPAGGIGAVVSREFDASGMTIPLIRVDDPLKGAQALAAHVRQKYRHIKYIGVTGSAGKTTTKEFIYQLLSHKYRAYRSHKNWNNWIGVPFCLLNMSGDDDVAVFELAMSYPGIGEIDLLAGILRPDVAVLLNAFPVHLEFLKTVENVATAKAEILNYLAADDVAFINGDLPHVREKTEQKAGRKIYLGKGQTTGGSGKETDLHLDARLKSLTRRGDGTEMTVDCFGVEAVFETAFINGIHNENLFVAIMAAQHLGMKHVEIQAALQHIEPLAGRGQIRREGEFTIIDETYNSNPEALKTAMSWIDKEWSGQEPATAKIAVVGDMLELGENETDFHFEVGQYFARLNFSHLITVGKRAGAIGKGALEKGFDPAKINSFQEAAAAGAFLKTIAQPGSVILFKASRGIGLEKAVEGFLKKDLNEDLYNDLKKDLQKDLQKDVKKEELFKDA